MKTRRFTTAMSSLLHAGRAWRGLAEVRRSASRGLWLLPGIILLSILTGANGVAAADLPQSPFITNAPIPKRGGTLRLALPTDVTSLDPALAWDARSEPFVMLLYQGLLEYDDGLNLLPCLATNWDISEDKRIYTFHLRPGVRFSNGRELVASDFVFSLERNLVPSMAAGAENGGIVGARDFLAGKAPSVRGLRAPRSDTLVIELEQPDLSFLYILTQPAASVVPREEVERFGKSFGSHPVGTGPYVLTQWRRGVKMRFERNPLSSQADRQNLDAIEVMVGGDSTLHLMMFERGELDIANISGLGIPKPDLTRVEGSPRWHNLIERMQAAATVFLWLNTEMEPFTNRLVRQAMNYAIDKAKVVRLLHGMATPANGILPSTMPGFNTNLAGYPFDTAKARQLLAASGHAADLSCKLWFEAGNELRSTMASAIQFDLAQAGITAQLNPVSFAPLVDSMGRRRTVQCVISAYAQDYPDPSDFLDSGFNGNRITDQDCGNYSFYNSPQVNKLLAEAAACKDPGRRLRIYQSAEQAIVDDAPVVPLCQQYAYALRQPWLHGVHLHPVLYFRFERMWIER